MRRIIATTLTLVLLGACVPDRQESAALDAHDSAGSQNGDAGAQPFDSGGGGFYVDVYVPGNDAVDVSAPDGQVADVGGGVDVAAPDVAPDVAEIVDVVAPDTTVVDVSVPDTGGPEDIGAPDVAPDAGPEDVAIDVGEPDVSTTTGSVEGVVWRTNGDPVKGAPVSVVGQPSIQALTDGQGRFLFEDLDPGKLSLLAGPTALKEAGLADVTIVAGKKANAGIITVSATGAAQGTIVAVDAPSQAGTTVTMKGTSLKSTTNALGDFALPTLPATCLTLVVQRASYQTVEVEACIQGGSTLELGPIEIWLEGVCVTQCAGKECGDDGCDGVCGTCPGQLQCEEGLCVVGGVCGDGACEGDVGETCANCDVDCGCGDGICVGGACCMPDCGGAECGGDGCGGTCGACDGPLACVGGVCLLEGGTCGDGTCDPEAVETCKTCADDCGCDGGVCAPEQVCCYPSCDGLLCGDDGCGGSCGDCSGSQVCIEGQCVVECQGVPPGGLPDGGPLPTGAAAGGLDPWTDDGFADDYLLGPGGTYRIGLRRDWGGAVVSFGDAGGGPGVSPTNVVDPSNGTRALHVALHDPARALQGCAFDASCPPAAPICPAGPSFLGWSPVQGINECGSLPGVQTQELLDGRVVTTTTLLQWNPDWGLGSCDNGGCFDPAKSALPSDIAYEQSVRWVAANAVEVQMTFTNTSGDAHTLADQDVPVIWASPGSNGGLTLAAAVDSDGKNVPLEPGVGGVMGATFESKDGWAMLLDEAQGTGLGLMTENLRTTFDVQVKAGTTSRLRAPFELAIGPHATVRARVYLILGDPDTVRSTAGSLRAKLGPFGAIDSPAEDQSVTQTLHVDGWVLDDEGVIGVELLVDAKKVADLPLIAERPDICAKYPGYATCGTIGYAGAVTLAGLSPCEHLAVVRATDTRGNKRVIDTVRFVASPGTPCAAAADCEDGDPCTIDVCDPLLACVRGPKPKAELKEESCNGLDDDCDGEFDEAPAKGCLGYYEDADEDAWGTEVVECLCKPVFPYTAFQSGDCDDADPGAWPGAGETCNGIDDNCDGVVDEEGAAGCEERWLDEDGDGWGSGDPSCQCGGGSWGALQGGDCDDGSLQVAPGMPEVCNGVDDDCDGAPEVDGTCPPGVHFLYRYLAEGGGVVDRYFGASKTPPAGAVYEAFGFVLFDDSAAERVPLFQSFCASCTDHSQSTDIEEGFPDYAGPSLLGYCRKTQGGGADRELVRLYDPLSGDHFVTTYVQEIDAAVADGYEVQGTLCWVP